MYVTSMLVVQHDKEAYSYYLVFSVKIFGVDVEKCSLMK